MTAPEILDALAERGWSVRVLGADTIEVRHRGAIPDELAEAIRAHKAALLRLVDPTLADDVQPELWSVSEPPRRGPKPLRRRR